MDIQRKIVNLFILTIFGISVACSPKVTKNIVSSYAPLDYDKEVLLLDLQTIIPDGAENMGTVRIGDTGFTTNCDWNNVTEIAKIEARKVGGNAIKIIEHTPPSPLGSSCHQITAVVLRIENSDDLNFSAVKRDVVAEDWDLKPEFPQVRLNFNGGWSYRLAPLSDNINQTEKEHIRKLKSGYNLNFDVAYYFVESYGVGFKYDIFKSSNSISYLETETSIPFIGPFFAMRFFDISKANCLILNMGIGYVGYNESGKYSGIPYSGKGSTAGMAWDVGYDIALTKNLYFGFQFSYFTGFLTEIDITDNGYTQTIKLEKGEYEGLQRLNLGLGLRLYL